MTSFDPSRDQLIIAAYYDEQAQALRQRASELRNTAALYEEEELFGPDSDEFKSTQLLAEYDEAAALQRTREAQSHREAVSSWEPSPEREMEVLR